MVDIKIVNIFFVFEFKMEIYDFILIFMLERHVNVFKFNDEHSPPVGRLVTFQIQLEIDNINWKIDRIYSSFVYSY